jgi:hypothetical protein
MRNPLSARPSSLAILHAEAADGALLDRHHDFARQHQLLPVFLMFSRPFTEPTFSEGCDAFVLGFSALGLRSSRFDLL